ncbi:ScyD/ScyE family protein [Gryllotalpicola protaetiae]|uniref:ScyD/ScyE family protein n=1 Tax=Gryllotalpicola protaetiae TaxID=2419771 RepID=A0A387BVW6_9MICO|nr:ScyD/ScyE family protein [Gryllotalpicola protaetiae]
MFALGGLAAMLLSVAAGSAAFAQAPLHPGPPPSRPPVHQPTLSVAATGVDSPRHLAFGPDGALYVAEAGAGGVDPARCVAVPSQLGGTTEACVGKTGAIGKLAHGKVTPVLSGLESVSQADTGEVLGPSAVAFGKGQLIVTMQDFTVQSDGSNLLLTGDELGKLVTAAFGAPSYSWQLTPDLAAFAAAKPQTASSLGSGPGETAYDSDPYDVVAYRGGYAIADAAANDVLWLAPSGQLSKLATLPATSDGQAVPDALTVGPDGALYVGGLRGAPSTPGSADVYRVVPGQAPTVYATGFSAITDLAFDRQGALLVLEFNTGGLLGAPSTPGDLVKVASTPGHPHTVLVPNLVTPTGLAVGSDGAIYIANFGMGRQGGPNPGEIDVLK